MEDTEYAPTCGLDVVIGRNIRRRSMDGKVLTQNVALRFVCPDGHDDVISSPFDIMGHAEVYCEECNSQMLLHDECSIMN